MSLYHEAADILAGPTNAGGSMKSRVFSRKDLKSQPGQIYALAIETCKWSLILKEVIESAEILRLERKLSPILSLLLVHDLLLAKRGIALPSSHGLRTAVERHRGRLQAELTKARIRRKLGSVESLKAHVERGGDNVVNTSKVLHPRWVRINTLKTSLEDQLDTTFSGYERVLNVHGVRCKDSKRLYIDQNIPNLVAVSPGIDLSKSEAYKSGSIIFQDKASCFPAYLLDPLAEDGDIIDTCSAPGNKTTHIAAILLAHSSEPDDCQQVIHAFEKNKGRAEILEKMVKLAGSQPWTKLYQGQDFLKTDPESPAYKAVGALLLDPSCSGSGIVGRDDMPKLHLPVLSQSTTKAPKNSKVPRKPNGSEAPKPSRGTKKRKRDDEGEDLVMVDDDGVFTTVNTDDELKSRLAALSSFQLELLLHAFKFPAAFKITYSTCSIHFQENEFVVQKALASDVAKQRGWRLLKREEQVRGMREWPVRGVQQAYGEDSPLAEACIRANEGDENGTMGFFLAGFVREPLVRTDQDLQFLRDECGHLVRDLLGFPVRLQPEKPHQDLEEKQESRKDSQAVDKRLDEGEWNGFSEDDEPVAQNYANYEKGVIKPKVPKSSSGENW